MLDEEDHHARAVREQLPALLCRVRRRRLHERRASEVPGRPRRLELRRQGRLSRRERTAVRGGRQSADPDHPAGDRRSAADDAQRKGRSPVPSVRPGTRAIVTGNARTKRTTRSIERRRTARQAAEVTRVHSLGGPDGAGDPGVDQLERAAGDRSLRDLGGGFGPAHGGLSAGPREPGEDPGPRLRGGNASITGPATSIPTFRGRR